MIKIFMPHILSIIIVNQILFKIHLIYQNIYSENPPKQIRQVFYCLKNFSIAYKR